MAMTTAEMREKFARLYAVSINQYPYDADIEQGRKEFDEWFEEVAPTMPSQDLRDFVMVETAVVQSQYGAPDVYWNAEHDCAVLVTDRRLVEIYRNPDHEEGDELYVADYVKMHRP